MIINVEIIEVRAIFGPLQYEYGWRCGAHYAPHPSNSIGEAQSYAKRYMLANDLIGHGDQIRWQLPPPKLERV